MFPTPALILGQAASSFVHTVTVGQNASGTQIGYLQPQLVEGGEQIGSISGNETPYPESITAVFRSGNTGFFAVDYDTGNDTTSYAWITGKTASINGAAISPAPNGYARLAGSTFWSFTWPSPLVVSGDTFTFEIE